MTNVKFRGIDSKTGKMVYGAYDQYTGQILTADFSVCVGNEPIGWVGASFRVLKGDM